MGTYDNYRSDGLEAKVMSSSIDEAAADAITAQDAEATALAPPVRRVGTTVTRIGVYAGGALTVRQRSKLKLAGYRYARWRCRRADGTEYLVAGWGAD